ncbi:transcriptional activator DEMETER [Tanacetum coccineum]
MKLNEVHKSCYGTLIKIQENLIDMVNKNELGRGNARLKGRDWNDKDVKRSTEMLDKIDQVMKRQEQLRRFKEYIGGRPKTINLVMDKDVNWTPLTPGKPLSGGSEDNGKATAAGEKETAQYDTSCVHEHGADSKESRKRRNGALDMNKKKRIKMRKHRPKIYDDSKPNKVKTPKTPSTPKTRKTVAPSQVQKNSQNSEHNSTSYGFESCKRSLKFDAGKSDNSGNIATIKRNLPRSCRFSKSLEASQNLSGYISETSKEQEAEENGRQDIQVYQYHSNISSKTIFLFTPAFEAYKRTIRENGKATTLGEQEAAQYDTSGAQDDAVKVPNSECEGEKARCGHESGVDIKESRKRRNEGLDMNKKKRPRMEKHNPKIYDDSQLNKVSKFQTSNSETPTPITPKTTTTPKTPKPVTPNRVQRKGQTSNHNNSISHGFESCKRSLDFDARKSDNSGKIATFKRILPRSCRFGKKSLVASQNLFGDNSETSNEKEADENGQKYFHVYQRRFNVRSNGICLITPAFELYQRRIKVNGRKDIQVYRRRSKKDNCLQYNKIFGPNFPKLNKKKRGLRKKPNTNRWYSKEDEEGKNSNKKVEDAITAPVENEQPKVTANVDLDSKSLSVWKMLMANGGSEPVDKDNDDWWQEQGKIFGRRMDSFLEKLRVVQGNMRFSPWKGSVTDSVVGAYLTQNVTDHLSSSAFMSVAARFPPKIASTPESDAVDWDAVRRCPVTELAKTIAARGMQNKLAKRIKVDFLNRIYEKRGSLDLEWLRNVPPHKAKEFLLSFFGLGLKSVECIRLLTLHHLAFPVDTNVARVATRLGWVPLQSLPDHVPIHHLNAYPPLNNIQKYLFPRLCTLDKEKFHRLAISGSKDSSSVTSIIPVTDELKQSMYLTLPRSSYEKEGNNSGSTYYIQSNEPIIEVPLSPEPEAEDTYPVIDDIEDLCNPQRHSRDCTPPSPSFYQEVNNLGLSSYSQTCEPIVEIPPSPEPEAKKRVPFIADIEDIVYESDDNDDGGDDEGGDDDSVDDDGGDRDDDMSQAIAFASVEEALDIRQPKKFSVKWRTMHLVYELPKDHPCLAGFEARELEDPTPYLLALSFPGEDRNSPEYVHNRTYILNKDNGEEKVQATVLIPCRTANRGSFPLNGTYFQVNEVFADDETSHVPLQVPRNQLVNLKIRILGCGTSTASIHRGLSTSAIQRLFCTDAGKISAVSLNAQKRLGTFKILLKKLVDDYVLDGSREGLAVVDRSVVSLGGLGIEGKPMIDDNGLLLHLKWLNNSLHLLATMPLRANPDSALLAIKNTVKWEEAVVEGLSEREGECEVDEDVKGCIPFGACLISTRYKIYAEGYASSVSLKYILACGSLPLIVNPKYEDFFSRGLSPKENYLPISPKNICPSIKTAIEWGNSHPAEAEAIGKAVQDYMEQLTIDRVYDYMYHLITEYAKLQDFKPVRPSTALEECVDSLLCYADETQRGFLERSWLVTHSDPWGGVKNREIPKALHKVDTTNNMMPHDLNSISGEQVCRVDRVEVMKQRRHGVYECADQGQQEQPTYRYILRLLHASRRQSHWSPKVRESSSIRNGSGDFTIDAILDKTAITERPTSSKIHTPGVVSLIIAKHIQKWRSKGVFGNEYSISTDLQTPELQSNEAIHHLRICLCKDEAHTSVEPALFMLISGR